MWTNCMFYQFLIQGYFFYSFIHLQPQDVFRLLQFKTSHNILTAVQSGLQQELYCGGLFPN